MYVIPGLRLNKFERVEIPTKRELFSRMIDKLTPERFTDKQSDEYENVVNFDVSTNKVAQFDAARNYADQQIAMKEQQEKSKK